MSAVRRLDRVAFTTSRLAEFVGIKELVAQVGQSPEAWPLVILRELADNALDECEEAGIAPELAIEVDTGRGLIIVADNGRGIPAETVAAMLDYSVRVSSREAYISPTRGAQGNALKTIVAMGFALDGERGSTIIESQGQRHSISFEMDAVRRVPRIVHQIDPSFVQIGARVTVHWPDSACSILSRARSRFVQMAVGLSWLNPHLGISCVWDGLMCVRASAADSGWGEGKWRPSDPTSPHWYNADTFARYIAAHIARDEDNGGSRTVRDFIAELRGLARSAKQKLVLDESGAARSSLSAFFAEGKNSEGVERLLWACQRHSTPVKPENLGFIGEASMRRRLADVDAEAVKYKRRALIDKDGTPWLIEAAFGWRDREDASRHVVAGINWSLAIADPFSGLLTSILADQWADEERPVNVILHVVTPRPPFADRGKSSVRLDGVAAEIEDCVLAVTRDWAKQCAREFRDHKSSQRRRERLVSVKQSSMSIKTAAEAVMEIVYLKASGGGQYPVKARQLMYAARPSILAAMTEKEQLDDAYFTQTLLPDYLNAHPEHAQQWDVVWDARGTFREPHTGSEVPLGTLEVRDYLARRPERSALADPPIQFKRTGYPTIGPEARYSTVLFVEKEGFDPLLRVARLADRFDVATMSTKGMSTTAARLLLDKLSARGVQKILVLHDFDVSGFSIFGTLGTNNRRYRFANKIPIFDIGLTLTDAGRMELESEPVVVRGDWAKRVKTLRRHGATEEDIKFLATRRVELNAMTSPQIIEFIEGRFREHGVAKLIPDDAALEQHARHLIKLDLTQKLISGNWAKIIKKATTAALPMDLREQIAGVFETRPELSWDAAVASILRGEP